MMRVAPQLSWGWFMQSWTYYCQGRPEEAYETLLLVTDRFPKDRLIRYELACYACKLGMLQESRRWLLSAADVSDAASIQKKAAFDIKLQPLWEWIKGWPVQAPAKPTGDKPSGVAECRPFEMS